MRQISPTDFRIAHRGTSREINRQIVLNLVRTNQPISRAELARLMGVRRGVISRLVQDLLDTGQIFEGAKGDSQGGRKPQHLFIETRRRCAVAIDISASRTLLQVTDPLGHPLQEIEEFQTTEDAGELLQHLAQRIVALLAHPGVGECQGIGVVVAGLVDTERGRLLRAPTLGWQDVDLRAPLEAATGHAVVVENSTKACALAQLWEVRDTPLPEGPLVFVNASDGVGVGIALDGQLVRGARNGAGEFGHVPIDIDGPVCACGSRGCWEAYASVRATVARYLGTSLSWPACSKPALTVPTIVERARAGEARACQVLDETGEYLGRGLAMVIKAVQPSCIYMSGEITEGWELVEPGVRRVLRELALTPDDAEIEIAIVPLGDQPRLRGAAALVTSPAFAAPVVA
ncbi:xylose repressor protein [Luteitalea sp. TBR-22]|nr:xylose repressor protein [Luteitalea sp. TBR-22]